jgi:2-iminobutanoate/2-iminopropanoate deaminase
LTQLLADSIFYTTFERKGLMRRQTIVAGSVRRFQVGGKTVDYSPAVEVSEASRLLFISGQNAFDEEGNVVAAGDIEAQARQTLKNVEALVTEAGGTMDDVVKVTAWITKPEYVGAYVKVRSEFFTNVFPASSTVVCDLVQDDLLIEVEAVAAIG